MAEKTITPRPSSSDPADAKARITPRANDATGDVAGRSLTLRAALGVASEHWSSRPGETVMVTMATKAIEALEALGYSTALLGALEKRHAVRLLAYLRDVVKLAPKTVASYYGAFRRMLSLNGVDTPAWPKAPTPPRKTRDPLVAERVQAITEWLESKGWQNTADLARVLRATGMRINVEAMAEAHLTLIPGDAYDTLHVVGKGGHERMIPVVADDAREVFRDPLRLEAIRAHSYSGHLQRWKKAVKHCGIQTRLATPHAVRHGYATEVLEKSGGNLVLVQELLGHADPATTAKYLSVDLAAKAKALTNGDKSE